MNDHSGDVHLRTLVDLLQYRARLQADQTCYTFLKDGITKTQSVTYAELDRRARAIAANMQGIGTPGDRALLMYPPGLEFIAAFFGSLYAGMIAVPAYPLRHTRKVDRVHGIIASATPGMILSTSSFIAGLQATVATPCIATDAVADDLSLGWNKPSISPDSLAILQYTSGSTATPKGVMVSHGNVLHNCSCIRRAFELTPDSVSVTWLPNYHDMGLIDGIILPIYGGFAGFAMAPNSFLQEPIRWLRAISEYRASHSGAPNFAYELCLSKTTARERKGLDLSCWTTAYNGAEPIRADTLRRFADAFEPCGFRPRFFRPCFGLAEATLMVTAVPAGEEPTELEVLATELERHRVVNTTSPGKKKRKLIGAGRPSGDTRVVIVDPESQVASAPGQVGEIWVSGSGVAVGYWQDPEETERTFRAHVMQSAEGPFLRTGDLGFLHDGELFVTGRLKDMFIVRGSNYYPQDIELTVEQSHPALRSGCGAAFTVVPSNTEQLVVAQEVERNFPGKLDVEEIAAAVRCAVAEQHELQIHALVLLAPGSIPKTSSGKIQRHSCRAAFLTGALKEIYRSVLPPGADDEPVLAPPGREELLEFPFPERRRYFLDYLRQRTCQVLGVSTAAWNAQRSLLQLGLDSLAATELKHHFERDFGLVLPIVSFLKGTSVEEVAGELARLLETNSCDKPPRPGHASSPELHPLSPGQEALWFLHQTAPESAAYNVVFAARIVSELDVSTLRDAIQFLSDRHSSLRTTITSVAGRPMQRVRPTIEVNFEAADASLWSADKLRAHLRDCTHFPFDFEAGPLMRARLYRRGPSEHILLLAAHHIVTDFWSLVLLADELRVVYTALKAGKPVLLAPLLCGPSDHGTWQAELLASEVGENQFTYWRAELAGAQSTLDLPTDRPRSSAATFTGATELFRWDGKLTAQLRTTAASQTATLFMLLLAAFQVLLHRYTGQEDIMVGSVVDGRSRSDFSGIVGYLVNQLPLRARLSGDLPFREFLGRVKETVLGALAHQDIPFPLLVERLNPKRPPGRSPLFQVMFVLQKTHSLPELAPLASGVPGVAMDLGDLRLESVTLERYAAKFDLTLTVVDSAEGLITCWEYNRDLFDPATITRMDGHLKSLLVGIIADPNQEIAALPLLSSEERQQMLVNWNQTQRPYPIDRCTHHLFEPAVRRHPNAIAVAQGTESLTYRELDERSNQLAHYLIHLGVGPEVLVGIFVERSIALVVALLGVLKAGGAYVPLDVQQPKERLAHILNDANAPVLLTQQSLACRLPITNARMVYVDCDWPLIAVHERERPLTSVTPENLAYVIYTSGSTGVPKGVMITHRGMVNYLSWCIEEYRVAYGAGAPVNSSIGFDATITSLFSPLMVGKKVVLLPEQNEVLELSNALRSGENFSIVKITPAHLELLKSHFTGGHPEVRVGAFIIGGEALSASTVEHWRAHAPGTRLINEYGPTETVVGCSFQDLTSRRLGPGPVPIGRPIANTELYVLDTRLQPVPIGVTGELFVGGDGVARGYLGNPGLTAENFIPHPFKTDQQARLYRTGDRARYESDGTIVYLGRTDNQVKIRGFRIELGEIEAALLQHPGICKCVVKAWRDQSSSRRLVAYVVWRAGSESESVNVGDLRRFLERKLPEYMIPSVFVSMEDLPLTLNGKVDRQNLPEPAICRPDLAAEYAPPATEIERVIASVWRKVLQLEEVGIDDNFFDLGGHSLLLAQVHQDLRERLNHDFSIMELLQFPNIRSLAKHLSKGGGQLLDFQRIHERSAKQKQAMKQHKQRRKDFGHLAEG